MQRLGEYSTIIIILECQNRDTLKIFDTVERNSRLGNKVKALKLETGIIHSHYGDEEQKARKEVLNLLPNLFSDYLSNLEEFDEDTLRSYIPVLNALKDSKLKHLKRLNKPSSYIEKNEIAIYASCMSLLQDRIENMAISEGQNEEVNLKTHCLYNKLDKFDKLTELEIYNSNTLEIQELENIVATCKSLKKLKFKAGFHFREDNSLNNLTNVVPSHNVETLAGDINFSKNHKMLLYIMKKFPKLHTIVLYVRGGLTPLDGQTLTPLLNFSAGIERFSVNGFHIDDCDISQTIGDLWTTASPGSKSVEIGYYDIDDMDKCRLELTKLKNATEPTISFVYPANVYESQYKNFIEKNGKYIGDLQFNYSTDDDIYGLPHACDVPKNFISYLFTHCPHLQKLQLEGCALEQHTRSAKKVSVEELRFKNCNFIGKYLSQLSPSFTEIKRLFLHRNTYRAKPDPSREYYFSGNSVELKIDMPDTKMDYVCFEDFDRWKTPYYIKLFVANLEAFFFYKYDGELKDSNRKEYDKAESDMRAYVRCLTKPKFKFQKPKSNHIIA